MRPPSDIDGFRVDECKSDYERRQVQLLVPILSPEKPTISTIKLMKALYKAYLNNRMTRWGLILNDVVNLEVIKIGGRNGCPLTLFIYHLYVRYGLLTATEKGE